MYLTNGRTKSQNHSLSNVALYQIHLFLKKTQCFFQQHFFSLTLLTFFVDFLCELHIIMHTRDIMLQADIELNKKKEKNVGVKTFETNCIYILSISPRVSRTRTNTLLFCDHKRNVMHKIVQAKVVKTIQINIVTFLKVSSQTISHMKKE